MAATGDVLIQFTNATNPNVFWDADITYPSTTEAGRLTLPDFSRGELDAYGKSAFVYDATLEQPGFWLAPLPLSSDRIWFSLQSPVVTGSNLIGAPLADSQGHAYAALGTIISPGLFGALLLSYNGNGTPRWTTTYPFSGRIAECFQPVLTDYESLYLLDCFFPVVAQPGTWALSACDATTGAQAWALTTQPWADLSACALPTPLANNVVLLVCDSTNKTLPTVFIGVDQRTGPVLPGRINLPSSTLPSIVAVFSGPAAEPEGAQGSSG